MKKTLLVIKREYLSRVMKKSFLLTTILVPLLIIGFYTAIIAITVSGSSDSGDNKQNIAILDKGGLFNTDIGQIKSGITFSLVRGTEESELKANYRTMGYDAYVYIPPFSIDSPGRFIVHSTSYLNPSTLSFIEDELNDAILKKRLSELGMSVEKFKSVSAAISLKNEVEAGRSGESKTNMAVVGYGVSYACGILIYMMMLIYGTQVMRGVMEEKTSRISEIMISSIRPFQLMMGKIIGIGAVGLTQFAMWIILIVTLHSLVPVFVPGMTVPTSPIPDQSDAAMMNEVIAGIYDLPLLKITLCFLFYFLLGYLTYASLFAAIGSVAGEDQQETQQLVFPVMMPIIFGFVILQQAAKDPNSTLAQFGSYFPLTSPIVMMGRITFDIPWWELLISMLLLVGTFILFAWMTGKIYRTGILLYGKKPSWKEMIKWGFRKG